MNVILERVLSELAAINRKVESLRASVEDLDMRQETVELALETITLLENANEVDTPPDLFSLLLSNRTTE